VLSRSPAARSAESVRSWLLASVIVAACGEPVGPPVVTPDGPIEVRVDPFAGRFEDPADFPRIGCTAGTLAGFARTGYWPGLGLRTERDPMLRTYLAEGDGELRVEHALTRDDLVVRASVWNGTSWHLTAIDVCTADADGTLHGAIVTCDDGDVAACQPTPVAAVALHRIEGEGIGEHLAQLGEYGGQDPGAWATGTTSRVRVQGDIAYVARGTDGIRIVSIANPAAPVELAHVHAGAPTSQILEVTDPHNPQPVAELAFDARAVAVEFPTAYLVDGVTSRIDAYDISRPQAPKRIAHYEPGGELVWHDVFVAGGIAYVGDAHGSGMHVIDFRDPAHPRELAAEAASGTSAWHAPSLTVVGSKPVALDLTVGQASRLRLLDGELGTPTFLAALGEWRLRDLVSMQHLVALGSRVYVANDRDGVRVIDLSDPATPVQVGYFNTWTEGTGGARLFEGALGIEVDRARQRIYVADSLRGLVILQGDERTFP
jgi:hypothetical protein